MYKIGEFSKITQLTAKTLRYYDEQGILQPSCRADNDYRLYDNHDFERAQLILLLRGLHFSIAEIKEVLASYNNKEDLQYYLEEKKMLIEKQIQNEQALLKTIDQYLLPKNTEVNKMHYNIEIKEYKPVLVAAIRYQGKYSDIKKYIPTLYKAAKDKIAGAPFNCYYDDEFKDVADIELCVPIKSMLADANTISKQLPKVKAIYTIHTGSYETINLAYKALLDYAKDNHIECRLPSREIYHKGPGMIFKGNPNKYITEIVIPIE